MGKAKTRILLVSGAAMAAFTTPATAGASQRTFDLPARPATQSIPEFARQAGIQIIAPGNKLRGIRTPALKGGYDVQSALAVLLKGTGLRIVSNDQKTITLASSASLPSKVDGLRMAALAQGVGGAESAQDASPSQIDADGPATAAAEDTGDIVVTGQTTRSVTQLSGTEIQKIMPGMAPIRAIQTLPGVSFTNADPWGNNEQNTQIFVHGFSTSQLGYTFDDVPLGDQALGNFNGLSPQRAVISENVGRVTLATGAAGLGTASASNLGGAIDAYSSDPAQSFGIRANQTVGSYGTSRTFGRIDTGDIGGGNALSISGIRHRQRAWDFDGVQSGYQANVKFVHEDTTGKLTLYFAYSDKTEPNEDGTIRSPTTVYQPYTRPFLYPDFQAALAYVSPAGAPPAADGQNYRNYYSVQHRTDYLTYAKYAWQISDKVSWSNQAYYHHDAGNHYIAGPLVLPGLAAIFNLYFPGQNAKVVTGNSGYVTRETEYEIDRYGFLSSWNVELGDHTVQLGAWYENNAWSQTRRWHALDVNNPSTPYQILKNPLLTQFVNETSYDIVQYYLQDKWQITPTFVVEGGFKSSHQWARGSAPVQPRLGSINGTTVMPSGKIYSRKWFLPQIGLKWDVTSSEQIFANAQQNLRQFATGGGLSPWTLGSQAAFDLFRSEVRPETAWTYDIGLRTRRSLDWGPITGIEGQINYYHVDFSDRLLTVNSVPGLSTAGGATILRNVGDVTTDGVDAALTVRFGQTFSLYNALSYNRSIYQDDYQTGTTIIRTAGKKVPGSPTWMNKTVATLNVAGFNIQAIGDYLGKRYATFTNDQSVDSTFMVSARIGFDVPLPSSLFLKKANVSLNVTNITQERGASSVAIVAPASLYTDLPIAPRQWFLTVSLAM
jgi:outer membrane receptor protein involved in Fe transport